MSAVRRVWIDTDMGFDDLAAILTIAAQRDVAIAGLSLVAGNAPLATVADNAARAASWFGWTMPIHRGAERPLVAPPATADYVLGPDGMATTGRTLPPAPARFAAADAIAGLGNFLAAGGTDVLALGPLTNVAALLGVRPGLARTMRLTWMGGSLGAGNHDPVSEFNAAVDPEAVHIVARSGADWRMVGLEPCRQVHVGSPDVQALRSIGSETALLLGDLLDAYVRIASADGSKPMSLYDPTAAAAWLDPDVLTWQPAHVAVELVGPLTRGMTVVERRPARLAQFAANAQVAVTARPERVRAVVLEALRSAAISNCRGASPG